MERVLFAPRDLPPLRPDAAADQERYVAWFEERLRDRLATMVEPAALASVDVLVSLDPDSVESGTRCLESIASQQLGDGPTSMQLRMIVTVRGRGVANVPVPWSEIVTAFGDGRSVLVEAPRNASVADGLAAAFAIADGDIVVVVEQETTLAPDAIVQLATRMTAEDADVVYADDDRIEDGRHRAPSFKPVWSPELMLSFDYMGTPVAYKRDLVLRAGGVGTAGVAWAHDLALRCTELATNVAHVPEVLAHRHLPTGTVPLSDGAVVSAALKRRGEPGDVERGAVPGTWHVVRSWEGTHRVSVIVPFRDAPGLLRTCLDSIDQTTSARSGDTQLELEYVLVDNGSVEPETLTLLDRLSARPEVTVMTDDRPFNWPALNNAAVPHSSGDVLLFLNNDIEARRDHWLELLVAHAIRTDVGAVGARLLYPSGRVQHVGVVIGLGGAAGHVLTGLAGNEPGYLAMAGVTRECAAVTGACLATRRALFDELGGFDERLGVDLNDVDYCLRLAEKGYRTILEAGSELVHHESPSRGTSGSVADIEHFIDRWEHLIRAGDGLLSPNLTRVDSSCALRGPDEEEWWSDWRTSLAAS